ncbi:hypothetical protein HGRIS_011695 [Hohenbuehelia grisea]|uniref:ELYS-like domain-containing protein n=1 Tax=Hohenbuehelia grisea TaxID=104357 RepID=A0ABR3JY35_9AGAR
MDVDASDSQEARVKPLISYFSTEPTTFAWRGSRVQELEERRALLNDSFIFDAILSRGGIASADTLFPPTDVASLERLLDAIESSTYDTLKKECLVYYLLKWQGDGKDQALKEHRCIPPQFAALSDAYWCLDAGVNIARAVSILSDCRLKQDYVSKIIHAISVSATPNPLIIRYIRTAKPMLTEPTDIEHYAKALTETNFVDAWRFQRTFSEADPTRRPLLQQILAWCIMPTPRPQALAQLVALPFSPYEESVINSLALSTPSPSSDVPLPRLSASALGVLQDLVFTRLIQGGKYSEAIKMDKRFSLNPSNSPTSLREAGADASVRARIQDRARTVQEVLAILPAAEKALLDIELDELAQGGRGKAATSHARAVNGVGNGSAKASTPAHDLSMSTSWEDIRAVINPSPSGNGSATPLRKSLAQSRPQPNGITSNSTASPSLFQSKSSAPGPSSSNPLTLSALGSFTSSTNGQPNHGTSVSANQPRTSFPQIPLTTGTSLGGSTSRPRTSVPSSVQAGISLFGGMQQQPQKTFTPASSVRNAFYEPPPERAGRSVNGVKRRLDRAVIDRAPESKDTANGEVHDITKDGEDIVMNGDGEKPGEEEPARGSPGKPEHQEADEEEPTLGYSLFSHAKPARTTKKASKQPAKRAQPPGAFTMHSLSDDDVDDSGDGAHAEQEPEEEPRRPLRKTSRTSNASASKAKSHASAPSSKTRTRSKRRTQDSAASLMRSVPGGLMDDDDEEEVGDDGHGDGAHDEEEEPQDTLAPLPARTTRSKTSTRRSRASVASSVGSEDEDDPGVQTRRRSSRLSTAHSQPATASSKTTKPAARRRR